MVSHVARCVPNAADNLLNEKPFTYTIHDEYKELKGRCVIKGAYVKATKAHYQKLLKDNVVIIDNSRKVLYKDRRELVYQLGNQIRSNKPPTHIKNLKENFITWASEYTQQSAEFSIDKKSEHISVLICKLHLLMDERRKRYQKISQLKTDLQAETKNRFCGLNYDVCQISRTLENSYSKMLQKFYMAHELNIKYTDIKEKLFHKVLHYPNLLYKMEKQLERMKKVYKEDLLLVSKKGSFFLREMLFKRDNLEKKCVVNERLRRKILVENRKKAAIADREVQESAGVRRMTKAMMEIENALLNDGTSYSETLRRKSHTKEQLGKLEDALQCNVKLHHWAEVFKTSNGDISNIYISLLNATGVLEKWRDEVYTDFTKKKRVLEKLNSNQYDQTSNFVSLNRKAEIHKCNLINNYVKVKRNIRKFKQNKLHPDKDPEYIINQIVCLHNMFYNWANVQKQTYLSYGETVPEGPTDYSEVSYVQFNKNIDAMSCLESFKEMYFELLSDIMKKVDSTNPMYGSSEEGLQRRICGSVVEAAFNNHMRDKLVSFKSRYRRVASRHLIGHNSMASVPKQVQAPNEIGELKEGGSKEYKTAESIKKTSAQFVQRAKAKRLKLKTQMMN